MKISTGDQVVVISGKDKGKIGKVLRVLKTGRVVVSDVNMRTKHIRSQPNRQGQIIRYEALLSSSNVMLIDPKTKKRSRVGYVVDEKGRKRRVAKRSGETVVAVKDVTKDKKALEKEQKGKKEIKGQKGIAGKERSIEEEKLSTRQRRSSGAESELSPDMESTKSERVSAPKKAPFWKGLGFGKEAMEEAELKEGPHMKADHSVPEQGKHTDSFTHKRGE